MGLVTNPAAGGGGTTTVSAQDLANGAATAPGSAPAVGSQTKLLTDAVTNLASMVAQMNAGLGLDTAAMAALTAAANPATQQVAGTVNIGTMPAVSSTFTERSGTRSAVTAVALTAATAAQAFAADATLKRFEATIINPIADIVYGTVDGTVPSATNYHFALNAKQATSVSSQVTLYGDDATLQVRVICATAGSVYVHSKVAP